MLSRILNIFVIKQRSRSPPHHEHTHPDDKLTEYYVNVGRSNVVRLRGMASDLRAITAEAWLSNKTYIEGYLEAAAKLIVFLVASMSGNMTQAGAIILMCLLLISAGLLALSNSHASGFHMHGRVAKRRPDVPPSDGHSSGGLGPPYPTSSTSWPGGSTDASTPSSALTGADDWAEKGQVGHPVRNTLPFDDSFDYN